VSQWRKGRFDYGRYLEQNGFAGSCYVKAAAWHPARVSVAALSRVDRLRITFLRWRHSLLERYRLQGAEAEGYAVLAAMTLGDRTALERDLREVYAVAGASHVLALSGLHVGVLYFFLTWLLPVRRFRLWSQTLLVMAVWAFALLAGLPVSLVRSAVMFSVFTIFSIGGRQGASLNTLSLAAILILLFHPLAVYDVGFQLSFMSVFGILLVMPAMREWLPWGDEWWKSWLLRPLASLLMVSVAAQMGVAPLVAYYFGRFPVWFLLTNLVAVPAVYLILLGGMLMLLLPFLPLAPIVVGIISVLNRLLTAIAHLPLASIEGLYPSVAQVVLCYVVMALLIVAATVACRRHVPDSRW
jgi:competence protein ComEC